jgi:adenine deaminase
MRFIESDVIRGILKVMVIYRRYATENCGISFVRVFGLQEGAIVCTNYENQNLVAINTSDLEIAGVI